MTGNAHDAALALGEFMAWDEQYLYSREGTTRNVYLINGVIYKVNLTTAYDENMDEYRNAQRLTGLVPDNVRIPEMSVYSVEGHTIIAMEYVNGEPSGECTDIYIGHPCNCGGTCMPEEMLSELYAIGWRDHSFGNAIRKGNTYYLIDLGY